MKYFRKTKFCLGLQIEHFPNEVLVHQSTYIKKVLKRFYMDKTHHLSSPMVVRSLDVKKDPFRPCEKDEELLGPEVPHISVIGALIYLANCIRPNILFLSIYQQDIVPLLLEDNGMVSNMYCVIFAELLV